MKTGPIVRGRSFFLRHKGMHTYILISAALLAALIAVRPLTDLVEAFNTYAALPVKQALARICDVVPYSVGEISVILMIAGSIVYIIAAIRDVIRAKNKKTVLYRRFMIAVCAVLTLAVLLELSLSAGNFARSFQYKSGITGQKSHVSTLYEVTVDFARAASRAGALVKRDADGVFDEDLDDIISGSKGIYDGIETLFPFLNMHDVRPKKVIFSKLMSRAGYTGFYFPLTGEANINIDCPRCLIPSTIAHEFAHQRGVAYENEANFVAILACTLSDSEPYIYSGWLLGYIYLSNALYKQDTELWAKASEALSEEVLADLAANRAYWAKFEDTTISKVSDAVYESYLKSKGQELGLQSYGAVVDLLIAYYS